MNKSDLDDIIEKNKAQPVGYGYIDIIVSRNNYKYFVADLVNNGYKIDSISWWEWRPEGQDSEYGLGGPESKFYNGWFCELPIEIDDINLEKTMDNETKIGEIVRLIETKKIQFLNEIVSFAQNEWLTPAIWLNVPKDWRNKYSA